MVQDCGGYSQWNLNLAHFVAKVLQTAILLQNTNLQIRTVLITITISHTMMSFVTWTLADVERQLENVMIRLNLRQKHGTGGLTMTDREKLIELIEKARKAMKKEEFSCNLAWHRWEMPEDFLCGYGERK